MTKSFLTKKQMYLFPELGLMLNDVFSIVLYVHVCVNLLYVLINSVICSPFVHHVTVIGTCMY